MVVAGSKATLLVISITPLPDTLLILIKLDIKSKGFFIASFTNKSLLLYAV